MSKIIEIAQAEIGYQELPNKKNKYGEWFGLNNCAWCAMFVSYCYDKAGFSLGTIDFKKGFASVHFALKHFTSSNELTNKPQPGDIVIFDWNADGNPDHVGIYVQNLGNGIIETIEGNTSDCNPSNGGCVESKRRKMTLVEAYIHPHILDKHIA